MSDLILAVTDDSFQRDVLEAELPVLVEFWAPWCGPCKALAPMLDRLATQHAGVLRVAKYDIDQADDSRARFDLRGVPTLVAYRHGREVMRSTGASASSLQAVLNAALFGPASAAAAVRSFHGDAALKARALQLLQDAAGAPAQADALAEDARLPSLLLARALGSDCAAALGLPGFAMVLLDGLFELAQDEAPPHDIAHRWLDALPVGRTLTGLLPALARVVLHDAALGLLPGLREQAEPGALKDFISALIDLQARGDAPAAAWTALTRELAQLEAQQANGPDMGVLKLLKDLCKPLDRIAVLDLLWAMSTAVSLGVQDLQPAYTAEDNEAMAVVQQRLERLQDEAVPPGLDAAAQTAWAQAQRERGDALIQAFWQTHPAIAQRVQDSEAAQQQFCGQRLQALFERLLDVARQSA